jgi:hypothetical protein
MLDGAFGWIGIIGLLITGLEKKQLEMHGNTEEYQQWV